VNPSRLGLWLHDHGIRPVAVSVLAIAVLALVAWLALVREDRAGAPEIRVLSPVASPASASGESALVPQRDLAAAEVGTDSELIEVCGLGWVEPKGDGSAVDVWALAKSAGIEEAFSAITSELHASADGYERAIGIVLDGSIGADSADALWREQLAEQAASSDDPRVYALAYRLCSSARSAGSCALLSAAQWARLDQGNGLPWLFMLGDAAARGDREAMDEALYRVGSSPQVADRVVSIAGPVLEHAGTSDRQLMAANLLATEAASISAALPGPDWQALLKGACDHPALADSNRRQLCDAAAEAMAERSDSLLIATLGSAVGRKLGWPSDRVLAPRILLMAQAELSAPEPGTPGLLAATGCERIRENMASLERVARVGEVQSVREWIAANGKSPESYLGRARESEAGRSEPEAQPRSAVPSEPASAPD